MRRGFPRHPDSTSPAPSLYSMMHYAYGGGCAWLRHRALVTGSPYWWQRYRWCLERKKMVSPVGATAQLAFNFILLRGYQPCSRAALHFSNFVEILIGLALSGRLELAARLSPLQPKGRGIANGKDGWNGCCRDRRGIRHRGSHRAALHRRGR